MASHRSPDDVVRDRCVLLRERCISVRRARRLARTAVALFVVLAVVLQVVAVPAVALAIAEESDGSSTHAVSVVEAGTSEPLADHTAPRLEQRFTFAKDDAEKQIRLEVAYDIPEQVSRFRVRFADLAGSQLSVVEHEGFERQDETTLAWDRSTSTPTVTLSLSVPSERISARDRGIERDDWAFATVPNSGLSLRYVGTQPTVVTTTTVEGDGYAADRMAFMGEYDRRDVTVGSERVRFIVGPGASSNLSLATTYLETAHGRFDFGVTRDDLTVFVLPFESRASDASDVLVTGEAFSGSFWVTTEGLTIDSPENAFAHEYVHTRLEIVSNGTGEWLTEATAEYFGYLTTLNAGRSSYEEFAAAATATEYAPNQTAVVLSEERTWRGTVGNYEKGAHVLAALDAEIRTRSAGEHTLYEVFSRQQRYDDYAAFRAQVVEVTDDPSLGPWLDRYVTTDALPPVPDDPTLYVLGGDLDPDGDTLTSAEEVQAGTNPFTADSDEDGLDDAREQTLQTDPLDADTDGDTLSDGEEVSTGTDPLEADTDGDGVEDVLDAYPTDPSAQRTKTRTATPTAETSSPVATDTTVTTAEIGDSPAETAVENSGFGVAVGVAGVVLVGMFLRRL